MPHDFKEVRSIIYGYDSRLLQSDSFQDVKDLATRFIADLTSIGRSLASAKPVVFLAHSLGGIILKAAILEMANIEENMLYSMRQVMFFGVPNKGIEISHWLPMVDTQPNENLIRFLSPNSQFLIDLDERFNGVSMLLKVQLISFYETELSPTAEVGFPYRYMERT